MLQLQVLLVVTNALRRSGNKIQEDRFTRVAAADCFYEIQYRNTTCGLFLRQVGKRQSYRVTPAIKRPAIDDAQYGVAGRNIIQQLRIVLRNNRIDLITIAPANGELFTIFDQRKWPLFGLKRF